ncbi:MAG: EF-hand domain-containing protein [Planctomycetaceae bacterium]|nr:EF-hand domain-containing protein [Planctomycetaceae bacterium]
MPSGPEASRVKSQDTAERVMFGRRQTLMIPLVLLAVTFAGASTVCAQTYRLVFLGPKSPVLVEAQITAGNWDLRRIRERYAEGAFERLDTDHDGSLNADEAARIPKNGRFSRASGTLGTEWLEWDKDPQDDKISRDELFAFLDVALGPALSVEKKAPRLAQTVRLYSELDANQDDRITPEEFEEGLGKLLLSDFDDDETLSVAELQPYPLSVIQAQQQQEAMNSTNSLPLMLATTEEERTQAAERLLGHIGSEELSSPESLGIPERFFRAFDLDRNGGLNKDEIVRYLEKAPAQLNLHVSLAPPLVNVGRISRTTEMVSLVTEGRRPVVDMAGVPVECVARNRSADLQDQVGLFKTRAMIADGDKNGYLDQGEFAQLQATGTTFQDVDMDGNEQVTREEVDLYFSLDGLAAQSRLVVTLSDEAKVLFNLLDSTTDNRLTQREIRNAGQIIRDFDRDGDAALSPQELASRFRFTFSQPELLEFRPDANMNANSRQGFVREETSGPLWFRRMDRNLDGDLSWREFLGPRSDFEEIDQDGDGLITLQEAEQAESKRDAAP